MTTRSRRGPSGRFSRRRLFGGTLAIGAGLAGLNGLSGCGWFGGSPMRLAWWGNPTRDELTERAAKLFTENTGIEIELETTGWDDYWDQLATQVGGNNPPDVVQMDYSRLKEFRSILRPLDDYVGEVFDLNDVSEQAIAGGTLDGDLIALTMAINSPAMMTNRGVLAEAGVDEPDETTTWDEWVDLVKQVYDNTPDEVYGSQGIMNATVPMEIWLRQRGKGEYTDDGKIGYAPADLEEWWTIGKELMDYGAVPDAETVAEGDPGLENWEVPSGTGAFNFHWSNIWGAFAAAAQDEVGMVMYPQGGVGADQPGQYYKPSMLISITADSDHADDAARLINGLLFEVEYASILGFERGEPPKQSIRDALLKDVDESDPAGEAILKTYEYHQLIEDKLGPVPPPPPEKAADIGAEWALAYEEAAFERMSVPEAVDRFFQWAADNDHV